MVGHDERLAHEHRAEGLRIGLPSSRPCEHAWAVHIQGRNLRDLDAAALGRLIRRPEDNSGAIVKPTDGRVLLLAEYAEIHGASPRLEKKPDESYSNIGFWGNPKDSVSWRFELEHPGTYDVVVRASSAGQSSRFLVKANDQSIRAMSRATASWSHFETYKVGWLAFKTAGLHTLIIAPDDAGTWNAIGLQYVELSKGVSR
jgi:hypothetical protein